MNWYLLTNIFAGLSVIGFLIIGMILERKNYKQISIKQITMISMLVAVSAVLTNALGYSIQIPIPGATIMLALGEWLIFVMAFLFGPFLGIVGAICADCIGSLISIGGFPYHSGYMLDKVIIAFMGGLILIRDKKNFLTLKIIGAYGLAYVMESILLNPIWQYSVTPDIGYVFVGIVTKLIKLPISLSIYLSLILITIPTLLILVNKHFDSKVWCIKNGSFQMPYFEFQKNTYKFKKIFKRNNQ